ncbi:MAG TPA: hypothetical protein VMB51_09535 [Solirubrobacteraceae bacterium]|nr:hypothetical protein [Solirubrobacteraceae bacterium]
MGDAIHIKRTGECRSSHTQTRSRPRRQRTAGDTEAVREKLIAAMVEVVAEGGDPRLR